MGQLKKKGHDVQIKNMIIHQITKEMRKDKAVLKCAEKVIDTSKSEKEKFFIADVKKSFSRPGLTYGIFEEQNSSTIFENFLDRFIDGEITFYDFTLNLMDHYKWILENEINATGSYLVFAEYFNSTTSSDYLLVLAINNKESYLFNEDLTLSEIKSIDLGQIDVASLINLTKWKDYKKNNEDIDTYLSFRRGLKDLSQYFMQFIGCRDRTTKTVGTKKLVTALRDFLDTKNLSKEERENKINEVYSYCIDCDKNGRGAFLNEISKILDENNPEEFQIFASNEFYSVSELISIDKNKINLLTRTKYISKNKDFVIEFENILLGEGKKIEYIEKDNSLIIKDLSKDLVKQIKANI